MKEKRQRTPEEKQKIAKTIAKFVNGEMYWVLDSDSMIKLERHLVKLDYQLRQVKKLLRELPEYT